MSRFGLVYMGSKEEVLSLIHYIHTRHYKNKTFVDLFTGGFSVSGYILFSTNKNVISNDLNKYIIDLYNKVIIKDKDIDEILYKWVSRETFEDVRDNPENYPKWYVGYVLNVWSFGCNQKDYLYAKDLEEGKRVIHEFLINNDDTDLRKYVVTNDEGEEIKLFEKFKIPTSLYHIDYQREKRLVFFAYLREYALNKDAFQTRWFDRLNKIENLTQMEHVLNLKKYNDYKDRVELHSKDYLELYKELDEKGKLKDAVIYCDPPYENTKQYRFGQDFDYTEFWEWFENSPYPIYVSSYEAPEHIKPLNFEFKTVKLDNGRVDDDRYAPKKKATENIYFNGKGDYEPTLEDLLFNEQ